MYFNKELLNPYKTKKRGITGNMTESGNASDPYCKVIPDAKPIILAS